MKNFNDRKKQGFDKSGKMIKGDDLRKGTILPEDKRKTGLKKDQNKFGQNLHDNRK